MSRCRICSSNDREQLVDDMAKAIWLTQESANPDNEWRPWENAGPYWQNIMRQFAEASLRMFHHKMDSGT